MPPQPTVAVVPCRGGWFISRQDSDKLSGIMFTHFSDLVEKFPQATIIIDIPIGLPENESRILDAAIRRHMTGKESYVFTLPPRQAIYADSFEDACNISHALTGKGVSVQAWGLVHKIQEVDQYLIQNPSAVGRIFESHPELCFARLAGAPISTAKKRKVGQVARLELLMTKLNGANYFYAECCKHWSQRSLSRPAILDAMVLLATAAGENEILTKPGWQDENGLPIRALIPVKER